MVIYDAGTVRKTTHEDDTSGFDLFTVTMDLHHRHTGGGTNVCYFTDKITGLRYVANINVRLELSDTHPLLLTQEEVDRENYISETLDQDNVEDLR